MNITFSSENSNLSLDQTPSIDIIEEERAAIFNHVLGNFNKEDEKSYLKNSNLAEKLIYNKISPNLFFFFRINMPNWLYIIGNIFCWVGIISSALICILTFEFFNSNKTFLNVEIGNSFIYIVTGIVMFITIMNGGLLGHNYGTIGKYNFFLNMILFPIVTYIFPLFGSIIYLGTKPEINTSGNAKTKDLVVYELILLAITLTLGFIAIPKLINLICLLINRKAIKNNVTLIKDYINNNSLDYKFISPDFIYLYVVSVLCSLMSLVIICSIVKGVLVLLGNIREPGLEHIIPPVKNESHHDDGQFHDEGGSGISSGNQS
jgi:hypothetical protein